VYGRVQSRSFGACAPQSGPTSSFERTHAWSLTTWLSRSPTRSVRAAPATPTRADSDSSPGGPLRRQAVARRRCRTPAHRGRLRIRRRVRPRQRLLAHPGVQLPGTLPLRHPRPSDIVCRIPALSLAGRFRAAPPITRAGLGRFAALPQGRDRRVRRLPPSPLVHAEARDSAESSSRPDQGTPWRRRLAASCCLPALNRDLAANPRLSRQLILVAGVVGPHYRASVGHAVSLDHKGAVEHSQTVPAQNESRHPH
jgi:hypothetical protein